MLGKHPDEYPRFRDCFLKNEEYPEYDNYIHVYTRTGGGNRESYCVENEEMCEMETFVTDFDDSFDCTYAEWIFEVPKKWQSDFDKIITGNIKDVSIEYQNELRRIYPKLKEEFDKIFINTNEKSNVETD
jgi:hypothetical protein